MCTFISISGCIAEKCLSLLLSPLFLECIDNQVYSCEQHSFFRTFLLLILLMFKSSHVSAVLFPHLILPSLISPQLIPFFLLMSVCMSRRRFFSNLSHHHDHHLFGVSRRPDTDSFPSFLYKISLFGRRKNTVRWFLGLLHFLFSLLVFLCFSILTIRWEEWFPEKKKKESTKRVLSLEWEKREYSFFLLFWMFLSCIPSFLLLLILFLFSNQILFLSHFYFLHFHFIFPSCLSSPPLLSISLSLSSSKTQQ